MTGTCHNIHYMLLETGAYPTHNLLSFDYFELSLQKYVGWFGIFDLIGRNLGCQKITTSLGLKFLEDVKLIIAFLLNKHQQFLLSEGLCVLLPGGKSVEIPTLKRYANQYFFMQTERNVTFIASK